MSTLRRGRGAGATGFGVTILRVVVGAVFLAHGAQKLLVMGHPGVTGMLTKLGVPMPPAAAWVLMAAELLCGLLLVLGLFTRLATVPLLIDMAVAFALVHAQHGFFLPMGFEFVLTLFAALLALAFSVPGALALDNVLFRRRDRI